MESTHRMSPSACFGQRGRRRGRRVAQPGRDAGRGGVTERGGGQRPVRRRRRRRRRRNIVRCHGKEPAFTNKLNITACAAGGPGKRKTKHHHTYHARRVKKNRSPQNMRGKIACVKKRMPPKEGHPKEKRNQIIGLTDYTSLQSLAFTYTSVTAAYGDSR